MLGFLFTLLVRPKKATNVIRNIVAEQIVYVYSSSQREFSGGTQSEQEMQDAFASWAQSRLAT
ncbi:hypothetical protein C0Z16_32255 [Paraburkholderia rhynchosiae]|uniref:Uncharacterized protein n=1 Tax=Paraburkholderia rhynchosiae TaxID=487049 RepID=A0ABX4UYW6_9BURK|nr:hypothetical protein C0Z16_32255 [Paraburkholderia rhynchosiae]